MIPCKRPNLYSHSVEYLMPRSPTAGMPNGPGVYHFGSSTVLIEVIARGLTRNFCIHCLWAPVNYRALLIWSWVGTHLSITQELHLVPHRGR